MIGISRPIGFLSTSSSSPPSVSENDDLCRLTLIRFLGSGIYASPQPEERAPKALRWATNPEACRRSGLLGAHRDPPGAATRLMLGPGGVLIASYTTASVIHCHVAVPS